MNTKVKQSSKTKDPVKLSNMQTRVPKTKNLHDNPTALSKSLDKKWHHVILFKPKNGFSFMLFWVKEDNTKPEPVAQSVKAYKTKNECLTAIKKMTDAMPFTFSSHSLACYDYDLKEVDTKIKRSSWAEI